MQRRFREMAEAFVNWRRSVAAAGELGWLTGDSIWAVAVPSSRWPLTLALGAGVSLWLGLAGPFGNFQAGPAPLRIAYQACLAALCIPTFGLGLKLALRLAWRRGLSFCLCGSASVGLVALPMSLVIASVGEAFFPQVRRFLTPLDWYLQTVAVMLPLELLWVLAIKVRLARLEPRPAGVRPLGRPATGEPVPAVADLAHAVIALQAEDHYVRVHTRSGSRLVAGRLSDAVKALGGRPGWRVHRSWWVAEDAVEQVLSRGRGWSVRLETGLQAAVSRDMIGVLRRQTARRSLNPAA